MAFIFFQLVSLTFKLSSELAQLKDKMLKGQEH